MTFWALAAFAAAACAAECDKPPPAEGISAEEAEEAAHYEVGPNFPILQRAQHLIVGVLTGAQAGPVARSEPPIYSFQLTVQVRRSLRGNLKGGKPAALRYSARQAQAPKFLQGKEYVVAAETDLRAKALRATWLAPAGPQLLKEAKLAASLPLGWSVESRKLISPWAALGPAAWPKDAKPCGVPACSKTGRPALPAGKGIRLTAEPVPPKVAIKWTNPNGDGQYKITVTNTTDKAMEVPALLSDETGILWNESLVIICQDKARPAPLARPLKRPPKPTRLGAGQSVSTVVNALRLKDVRWPRGGYRVEFLFCLGELGASRSFYYLSRHHDPIRKALEQDQPPNRPAPQGGQAASREACNLSVRELQKRADRISFAGGACGPVIKILCPSGIGWATVACSGPWPSKMTVRLRYAENRAFTALEGFHCELLQDAAGSKKLVVEHAVVRQDGAVAVELKLPQQTRGWSLMRLQWVNAYR